MRPCSWARCPGRTTRAGCGRSARVGPCTWPTARRATEPTPGGPARPTSPRWAPGTARSAPCTLPTTSPAGATASTTARCRAGAASMSVGGPAERARRPSRPGSWRSTSSSSRCRHPRQGRGGTTPEVVRGRPRRSGGTNPAAGFILGVDARPLRGLHARYRRAAALEGGSPVHLTPKALALLECLVEKGHGAVAKGELLGRIWPSSLASEASLTSVVKEVRRALGDSARAPRYLRGVRGFGYAFCADLRAEPTAGAAAAPAPLRAGVPSVVAEARDRAGRGGQPARARARGRRVGRAPQRLAPPRGHPGRGRAGHDRGLREQERHVRPRGADHGPAGAARGRRRSGSAGRRCTSASTRPMPRPGRTTAASGRPEPPLSPRSR